MNFSIAAAFTPYIIWSEIPSTVCQMCVHHIDRALWSRRYVGPASKGRWNGWTADCCGAIYRCYTIGSVAKPAAAWLGPAHVDWTIRVQFRGISASRPESRHGLV